ncbi:MAG: AGE family epimerase/isomerase [Planctomycetota bacterium]|nr:AGE family epimerase/isomerase [Planctomycetota bacterium]
MKRMRRWIVCVALFAPLALWLSGCVPGDHGAQAVAPLRLDRETCLRLADQMEAHLRTGVLAQWFPACVDREHGGFRAAFTEKWKRGPDNDKFLVFQGRMTWVSAQVAMRYPELAEAYKGYARHGVRFLNETMWDREQGGLFWGLDENGKISGKFGDQKHVYGIAFGIYGAAAAYQATGDQDALDLARRTFAWLDSHAHDEKNGGYFEALARDGKPIMAPSSGRQHDGIGTLYGYKSMNSHIHVLEALTELYRAWPDKQVEARLREVFAIVRDRIAVPPGCLNLYFTPDWRPVPDHDSFGHDVETAYLLVEAAEALKEPEDAQTWKVARSLVDHALEWGWDEENGGFYDKGGAFTAAYAMDKIWWSQAEGLNALLLLHGRFGSSTDRYSKAFLKQWDFIWNHQVDHKYGEWYESVSREGRAKPGQAKGQIWKAAYHNGRTLMNVSAGLRRAAKDAPAR